MGLTMREKRAVSREMALEYKRATKKNKGRILEPPRLFRRLYYLSPAAI